MIPSQYTENVKIKRLDMKGCGSRKKQIKNSSVGISNLGLVYLTIIHTTDFANLNKASRVTLIIGIIIFFSPLKSST